MYCERVEPGVLLGFVVLLVDVAATASPRGSDMGPTGGPVDAPGEARGFDDRLGEDPSRILGPTPAGPLRPVYVLHYRALAGRMGNSCRRKDEDLP